jgi:hypothetical protein
MIPEISIQTLRVSADRKTFDKSDLAQIEHILFLRDKKLDD